MNKVNIQSAGLTSFFAAVFLCKILLFESYHSTDFEVHRNWLSITYNLPISEWYSNELSQWTLDYPPIFALFQYLLSLVANWIDPSIVVLSNQAQLHSGILYFQRVTVLVSDVLYMCAVLRLVRSTSVLGWLTGLQLLSLVYVLEGSLLRAAFSFTLLCCSKHIYLYFAPAFAVYYLRMFCFKGPFSWRNPLGCVSWLRCIQLASTIITVFACAFGPFLYLGQLPNVINRLFPVRRGLTHAYWAPNIWALYNLLDLVMIKMAKLMGYSIETSPQYTTGLVQEYSHVLVPNISPLMCVGCTLLLLAVVCCCVAPDNFHLLYVLCGFSSFLCGWHVHEKAALTLLLPALVLALKHKIHLPSIILLANTTNVSLLPLLFTAAETPTKCLLGLLYALVLYLGMVYVYCNQPENSLIGWPDTVYHLGLFAVTVYSQWLHSLLFGVDYLPFIPLMLVSVYCSIGMCWVYCRLVTVLICDRFHIDVYWNRFWWTREQKRLKEKLIETDSEDWMCKFTNGDHSALKFVGALDISTQTFDTSQVCVALAVCHFPTLKLVESLCIQRDIRVPYIPGFLAWRECSAMCEVYEMFVDLYPEFTPQILMIDGNGILHPRGFGLACSVGVHLNIACFGVAKNLHHTLGLSKSDIDTTKKIHSRGERVALHEQINGNNETSKPGRQIGSAVFLSENSNKPIFVSVGHRISLGLCEEIVLDCAVHKQPEPIRYADGLSRAKIRDWI